MPEQSTFREIAQRTFCLKCAPNQSFCVMLFYRAATQTQSAKSSNIIYLGYTYPLKLNNFQCILIPPRVLYSYKIHVELAHTISLLQQSRIFACQIHLSMEVLLIFAWDFYVTVIDSHSYYSIHSSQRTIDLRDTFFLRKSLKLSQKDFLFFIFPTVTVY